MPTTIDITFQSAEEHQAFKSHALRLGYVNESELATKLLTDFLNKFRVHLQLKTLEHESTVGAFWEMANNNL